jgi:uncharacterized phage-associated protein
LFNSTRDGHAAWLALIEHYEGDAQRDRVKDAAYTAISQARYFGDRKKFSFETYVTIHQEAFEDLEQYGQQIPADKRVRDLLQGIKDPKANAAKETVLANATLRNDFLAAVSHLATSLQLQGSISDSNIRNVSGLQTGKGRGKAGRGRGRGHNIYLGNYMLEQWAALSSDDKRRVREGREKSSQEQQSAKRNISNVTVEDDATSALTMGTATQAAGAAVPQAGASQATDTSTAGQSMSRRQRINAPSTTTRKNSHDQNVSKVQAYNLMYYAQAIVSLTPTPTPRSLGQILLSLNILI